MTMARVPSARRAPFRTAAFVVALCLLGGPGRAQAQQTFNACYVPSVGAVYLIGLTGLPTACLATSHVQVTLGGGALADGSVTAVKLADGAVVTIKLADGGVTRAKLAFDPGTVTSVTAGAGLAGGTITTTGALSVDFAGSGAATTVARSDHTHASGYEIVQVSQYFDVPAPGYAVSLQAVCPADKKAVGGGFGGENQLRAYGSAPIANQTFGAGWTATFEAFSAGHLLAKVWAVCVIAL